MSQFELTRISAILLIATGFLVLLYMAIEIFGILYFNNSYTKVEVNPFFNKIDSRIIKDYYSNSNMVKNKY